MTFQEMTDAAISKTGSLTKLARQLELTARSITNWRDGLAEPTPEKHAALAELIGVEVDDVRKAIWESKLARLERRRKRGDTSSTSTWISPRRPLAKADRAAEPRAPKGADRLHRMMPAHA